LPSLATAYKNWWIELLKDDPVHVFIETSLLLFIGYLVFVKRSAKDWREERKFQLSEGEKQELIEEWEPAPLCVPEDDDVNDLPQSCKIDLLCDNVVIHKVEGTKVKASLKANPNRKSTVLNFSGHDFLGMGSSNENLKNVSRKTMQKYGCGSCGPRGFYGTIDVHLALEEVMRNFCGTDDAIMYSDGASAVSSAVAAFAKRGDLLVVDEAVYESLQTGVTLSRASVKYFKHNDVEDLRRVLERIAEKDSLIGRKSNEQRRFIVVEGLYKNYGDLAPIDEIVKLKHEFGYRLIVDESFGFGTVGQTGKGVTELCGMKFMDDVEIVTVSLENAIASVGGICIGDEEVIDHQRLSGAGYCFSASAPPFTASAAIASIEALQARPELIAILANNRKMFLHGLKSVPKMEVISDEMSSIIFVRIKDPFPRYSTVEEVELYNAIVHKCFHDGVLFISTAHVKPLLHLTPPPSIRITVSAAHTKAEIDEAVRVLNRAVKNIIR